MFVCFVCLITDILWPVLCGYQPLQEPAHLFRKHHWDVQREEEARDASTHLCHLWVSIPLHASRYVFLKWTFYLAYIKLLTIIIVFIDRFLNISCVMMIMLSVNFSVLKCYQMELYYEFFSCYRLQGDPNVFWLSIGKQNCGFWYHWIVFHASVFAFWSCLAGGLAHLQAAWGSAA